MSEWAWVAIGFVITFATLAGYTFRLRRRAEAIRQEREQR
ncbi:CcmD family protein [Amycolatopsis saalfeldensis]|uniref:CcmD family protein n=1 Tax=Amycolatopsis saalfeldensis TaxID=394193 RepID=A0A1H8YMW8_9PSEU|nr:CcmD family protein [Amycolatopsis saalfeldensis]